MKKNYNCIIIILLACTILLCSCGTGVRVDKEYEKELIATGGPPTVIPIDPPTKCYHRQATIRGETEHWTQCELCGEVLSEKIPHEAVSKKELPSLYYIAGVPCKAKEERCSCNKVIRTVYTPIDES